AVRHLRARVHTPELAGVVDVAVLYDVGGLRQWGDVEGLRFPAGIGDGAVAEPRDEAAVAGMPVITLVRLHTQAESLLPIHQHESVGDGTLGLEAHDRRVERRIG